MDRFAFLLPFAFGMESWAFAFECELRFEWKARLSLSKAERRTKAKAGLSFEVLSAFRMKAECVLTFEGVARATPSRRAPTMKTNEEANTQCSENKDFGE